MKPRKAPVLISEFVLAESVLLGGTVWVCVLKHRAVHRDDSVMTELGVMGNERLFTGVSEQSTHDAVAQQLQPLATLLHNPILTRGQKRMARARGHRDRRRRLSGAKIDTCRSSMRQKSRLEKGIITTSSQFAVVDGQESAVSIKGEDAWDGVCESWEERADLLEGGQVACVSPPPTPNQVRSEGLQVQVESTKDVCTIDAPMANQFNIPCEGSKGESEGLFGQIESTDEPCTVSSQSPIQVKSEGLHLQVESTMNVCTISAPLTNQDVSQGLLPQVESAEEVRTVSSLSSTLETPFTGLASSEQHGSGFVQVGQQFGAESEGGCLLGGKCHQKPAVSLSVDNHENKGSTERPESKREHRERWESFGELQEKAEREGVSFLEGSTVNVPLFTQQLRLLVEDGEFEQSDADYLIEGVTWGFDLGVDESKLRGKVVHKNYKSAFDNKQKVTNALAERVSQGKTVKLGAFDGDPSALPGDDATVVPIGAVGKKLEPDHSAIIPRQDSMERQMQAG